MDPQEPTIRTRSPSRAGVETTAGATGGVPTGLAARRRRLLEVAQKSGIFCGLVGLLVVFSAMNANFFTTSNLTVILLQVSVVGIIAVPGAMLLLTGYVDLAVGSIAVLTAVVFGRLAGDLMPVELAGLLSLLVGAGWGALSGVLIAYLGLSPIVVTLGGLAGARGLAELINASSTRSGFGDTFVRLGNDEMLGIPVPVYLLGLAFVLGAYVWYVAPWGRHMMAIGADREAAGSLGVAVRAIPFTLYVASGSAAGLGGLIVTSQLDSASLSIGTGLEIEVLTGILIGGVAFTGGRGSLLGVLLGVLFIGVLRNGLIVINISPFLFGVVVGVALIAAGALEVLYQKLERIQVGVSEPKVDRDVE